MRKLPKILQVLLYVFLGLLVLIVLLSFFADPLAKIILEKQVKEASKGQYSLRLEEVKVSLLKGQIRLSGIQLKTDTSKAAASPVVEMEAEELEVRGFSFIPFFLADELVLKRVSLEEAKLFLKLPSSQETKSKEPFSLEQLDIYPFVQDLFDEVYIGNFQLQDLRLEFIQKTQRGALEYSASLKNLESRDILIEESTLFTSSRTFYGKSHDLDLYDQRFLLQEGKNIVTEVLVDTLHLETAEEVLSLDLNSFRSIQQDTEKGDTLLLAHSGKFNLQELNMGSLLEEKSASAKEVSLQHFSLFKKEFSTEPVQSAAGQVEKSGKNIKEFSLGKNLPDFLDRFELEKLSLEEISLELGNKLLLDEGLLIAEEVVLDKRSAFAEEKFLHASSIRAELNQLGYAIGGAPHHISISNLLLEANKGKGDLSVKDLKIESAEEYDKAFFDVIVEVLSLQDFNTREIPNGELELEKLLLQSSMAIVQVQEEPVDDGERRKDKDEPFRLEELDLYQEIEDQFDRILVKSLQLQTSNILFSIKGPDGLQNFTARELDIESEDVLIAPEELFSEGRIFYARQTKLEGDGLKASQSGKENWVAEANEIELKSEGSEALLAIRLASFLGTEGKEMDTLLFLAVPQLNLEGLDLQKLQEQKLVSIEKVAIIGSEFYSKEKLLSSEGPSDQKKVGKDSTPVSSFSIGKVLPSFVQEVKLLELVIELKEALVPELFSMEEAKWVVNDILLNEASAFADDKFLNASFLQTEVEEIEFSGGEPLHQLTFSDVFFVVKDGAGTLSSQLAIKPKEEVSPQDRWLEAEIELVKLQDFSAGSLAIDQLVFDSVFIQKPKVVLHIPEPSGKGRELEEKERVPDLFPFIEGKLDSLVVKNFSILEGDIRLSGIGGSYYGLHIPEINARMEDIIVAQNSAFAGERVLHSSDILVEMENLLYLFPDNVYRLQIDQLNLSSGKKSLEVKDFVYGFSENYEKKLESEGGNEVYRVQNDFLLANEVEWDQLLQNGSFIAERIFSNNLDLYVYKDLNLPDSTIKPLPDEMLQELKIPLYIQTLILHNMSVRYEEKAEGAEVPGLVDVTDLDVLLKNLTNMEEMIAQNPDLVIEGEGKIMGKGNFETIITVPLLADGGNIRVTGNLDTLDITELNRIARFNSRVAAESGTLYKVRWDFEAGPEESAGTFEVSYEDLRLQLSSANSPDTTGILKDVGSFLANVFVVESSIAEEKTKEPKEVKFKQKRDKERSFFNYYVKSLLAGLMKAVGVPF